MTQAKNPLTLRVGIDESLDAWGPEIKYVLRTLLRLAGFAHEFVWIQGADAGKRLDIYYGPKADIDARINIASCGKSFAAAPQMEVLKVSETDGISFLNFCESNGHKAYRSSNAALKFSNDIVFACYWLLTGARETHYQRDKWDNFKLDGSSFLENSLAAKPLVSVYGSLIRKFFKESGCEPLDLPWTTQDATAAFVLSHDVDYPQIIRSIECLRLLKSRGRKSLASIKGVLNGTNHFWTFSDWVEFEKSLGVRSAFYFMARKGSLFQYATGTPDGFYDIKTPEFTELFRYLKDEGCEVGLHASYNAYHDVNQLRLEKTLLEEAAGIRVEGNRHHYWRLNPAAPHETLHKHEQVGLIYDSSLAFEFYPGFRRGICHPFHVFHPGQRRELDLVELPPAWMDDHFDRRLEQNQIVDPESYARSLIDTARATNGVVVVDYHPRGMNADFYPRYGPWLKKFVAEHLDSSIAYRTPRDIARDYVGYEKLLDAHSLDHTASGAKSVNCAQPELEFGPMRAEEVGIVAQMHFDFFGVGEMHGHSLANLGVGFLEHVFYRLSFDNPYFFVDVARYRGEVVAYSVYASDWRKVLRETLRRHFGAAFAHMFKLSLRHPIKVMTHLHGNLSYLTERMPEPVKDIPGCYLLLGIKEQYRTREFRQQSGVWIAGELWARMEKTLIESGCNEFWSAIGAHNPPINQLFLKLGTEQVALASVQGVVCNFYRKSLIAKRTSA